jgi:hypothetical protein
MERQSSPFTQDLGSAMKEGQETMSQTGHKADQMAAAVGERLGSAADTLRGTLPQEGRLGGAVRAVTDGLEASGNYLQEQGLTGAIEEVESLIRRYPIQALLLGAGLGYALSRLRMR